jgi:hypothetical protein
MLWSRSDNRDDLRSVKSRRLVFDEQGFVAEDLYCLKCHYNLRGVRYDGVCPECGMVIGDSDAGPILRLCDPAWVAKLGRGSRYLAWSLFGLGLLMVTWTLFVLVFPWRSLTSPPSPWVPWVGVPVLLASFVVGVLAYRGQSLLCIAPLEGLAVRSRLRVANDVVIAIMLLVLAMRVAWRYKTGFWGQLETDSLIGTVLLLAGVEALILYIRKLVKHAPDVRLARQLAVFMVVVLLVFFLICLCEIAIGALHKVFAGVPMTQPAPPAPLTRSEMILLLLTVLVLVVPVVAMCLWGGWLLSRCGRVFREIGRQAEARERERKPDIGLGRF